MNNKGFTLIELLAVLVILTAIMSIALPSISSSMERTKGKQDKEKQKLLESYAEIFVTDNKTAVYKKSNPCRITFAMLSEYLPDDATIDSSGNQMNGYIQFTRPTSGSPAKYEYKSGSAGTSNLCQ